MEISVVPLGIKSASVSSYVAAAVRMLQRRAADGGAHAGIQGQGHWGSEALIEYTDTVTGAPSSAR